MTDSTVKQVLLITGLSGAGKSTALKTLEDIGWETIDNFPIRLLENLLNTPLPNSSGNADPPLAIGFDSRTRGFEPNNLIETIQALQANERYLISTLYLDCAGIELERRYSETRRRHPLALDRPAKDGIALERTRLDPLRRWADHVIDTSTLSTNSLQKNIRQQFAIVDTGSTIVTITSFGFSRGLPNNIDLLFDVRFLANPFWEDHLKLMTGLDEPVGAYISNDSAYQGAMERFEDMLKFLLPKYQDAGKSYVNVGIGCTGGRHRSVHVAEALSKNLHEAGFSTTVSHRNLASRPMEALEAMQKPIGSRGI
jgi:RNase adapter protein RapZ